MTLIEKRAAYRKAMMARSEAVSYNQSRRMRGLSLRTLPPKPGPIKVRIAYEPDGTYGGMLEDGEECPPGLIVKIEKSCHH